MVSLAGLITLSVVSHDHGPLLDSLLHDLEGCQDLSGVAVIVTLNVREEMFDASIFPSLQLYVIRNDAPRGFGANHNRAFSMCRTSWFIILNPDLKVTDSACFRKLLAAGESVPCAALLAPLIRNSTGEIEDAVRTNLGLVSLIRRTLHRDEVRPDTAVPAMRGAPFYWLAGMFLLINARVFRELSGFDERFFLYCEDYDLSARVFNAGYSILQVPSAEVVHDAQRDSHRSFKHLKLHIASLMKVWSSSAFWRVWAAELVRRAPRLN